MLCLQSAVLCISEDGSNQVNQGDNTGLQSANATFTALPSNDEPNTLSPDIVQDGAGNYHAVYTDIDGILLYGYCDSNCNSTDSWQKTELSAFELTSTTGGVTARLLIDSSEKLHAAVAVNAGGGGIFSSQLIYYGNCASSCTDASYWSIEQVAELTRSVLEQDAQTIDWFALTPTSSPSFTFIEPEAPVGDEYLWFFSCDTDCLQQSNWTRAPVMHLNLASSTPAHLLIGSDNIPKIVYSYQIIGAFAIRLMFVDCQS